MTKQAPPKIEFPCEDYPIKILGEKSEDYKAQVLEVVSRHAPGFDASRISGRDSSKGRFQSVTVFITATGVEQLEALHQDLKNIPATRMVL